jgi:lysophospholipase L1-like esterase
VGRRVVANLALLGAASVVALGLGEALLRAALDEVDYLTPRLVPHPRLGHAIEPGSAGHDAWGFRNRDIPRRVPVVAIGDSQTYGVSAPADATWPAQLSRKLQQPVYNLALGGYGPGDYVHLLQEYAPRLDARTAVVGFYFGNDLIRASQLAGLGPAAVVMPAADDSRFLGHQRSWLARSSMLYQVTKFRLPALADYVRGVEAMAGRGLPGIPFEHPVAGTVLTPAPRFEALDLRRPRNQRGLEATKAAFLEIDAICRERGMSCFALLIPTKESVYADAAQAALPASEREELARMVDQEQGVHEELTLFLAGTRLTPIDPLPALRSVVTTRRLYARHHDGHPNGAGYGVIADAVFAVLAPRNTAPPRM